MQTVGSAVHNLQYLSLHFTQESLLPVRPYPKSQTHFTGVLVSALDPAGQAAIHSVPARFMYGVSGKHISHVSPVYLEVHLLQPGVLQRSHDMKPT